MNAIKAVFNQTVEPVVPAEWLRRKVDSENLTSELDEVCVAKFIPLLHPNDEIWYYDNQKFGEKAGRAGYAIVRGGKAIYQELWAMN